MPTFTGTTGNDYLPGSAGADLLIGLAGDDTYLVDDAGDIVVEAAGEGNDTVYALVSYALAAGSHVETLSVTDHAALIAISLTGNEFNNNIYGNSGANILNGGAGADVMLGFGGDDVFFIDNAGDLIGEGAGGGNDTAYTTTSYALNAGAQVETLSVTDHGALTAINLTGNEFGNNIYGNSGANIINGGGGADLMLGFGGDDVYFIDNAGDLIGEGAGGGNDTVYAFTSYALNAGAQVETLSVTDHGALTAINLTGNEFGNNIYGNSGANILNGGGGADFMLGFGGDDVYFIDNAGDLIGEGAGGGNDTAYAFTSYALNAGAQVETLSVTDHGAITAINLTGNEFNNNIYGNSGANILNGGGGADFMLGFGGDDVFFIDNAGDLIGEGAGGGGDTAYAFVSYALNAGAQVEVLSVTDHGALTAINLTGNEFNNNIYGNSGANILNGGGGADYLLGFGGADTFAFTSALGGGNVDLIGDFAVGTDKIQLGGAAGQPFSALASGALRSGTLVFGAAALDADDYLLYNSVTGALLYDADGNGAGAAVQFATLSSGLALTVADFTVSGAANNAPAITSGASASVVENSAASTIVYQTVATDADGDRITYSLTGTDASAFTIDANGAVRLINPADFETKSSYSFNVVASDSATSTPRAVTLTVTDITESAPTPIINETASANDSTGTAQFIDRNIFLVANNGNLPDQSLPSATIVGDLPNSTDKDFFSITLQAGEKLILDVDFSGGNLDSFLRVYGPNGVELGSNDDAGGLDPGSTAHPTYGHNTDSTFSFRATTSGTYYFSIESFQDAQNPTFGTYQINVSIGPVATPAQIIAEDVDALISGAEWDHTNLTFSFPTSASQYPDTFKEVNPATDFQAFSGVQQAATRQLFQLVANVSSLTFSELIGGTGTATGAGSANLRFAMSTDSEVDVAYAYYPTNNGPSSAGGSAWFNTTSFNQPVRGNYAWMGILHEAGHALGLKHGHEPPAISPERDSTEYSVMTYRSYPGQDISDGGGGYSNGQFSYPQTLMMYDVAALQKIYGANYGFNAGNSVYTWVPNAGETSINGIGQGQVGDGGATTSNRIFLTIWDGGGIDTYNLSAFSTATTIDLRPGEWTTTSAAQLANLGDGHFARGNIANALMFQDNTASLIENAIGGSGADTIIANQVANSLTGNGGADTFAWRSSIDAGTASNADTITDFLRGSDKISLVDIDANPATGPNDAFTFIDTSAFHNVAGEVRYQVEGSNLRIQADLDGNGVADMEIVLNGNTAIAASDFFF